MKNKILTKTITTLFIVFVLAFTVTAQDKTPEPNMFKVGDRVEADYMGWYPGKVIEVKPEGYQYKIELYPPDGKEPFEYLFHYKRVRAVAASNSSGSAENKAGNQKNTSNKLAYGKYGCISTTGSAARGNYQIHPRGSFVITAGGKYTYYGYENPSPGTFKADDKGVLQFKGGAFDGGEATPLGEGYENQFFLVYPTITDNRWKCKLVTDEK